MEIWVLFLGVLDQTLKLAFLDICLKDLLWLASSYLLTYWATIYVLVNFWIDKAMFSNCILNFSCSFFPDKYTQFIPAHTCCPTGEHKFIGISSYRYYFILYSLKMSIHTPFRCCYVSLIFCSLYVWQFFCCSLSWILVRCLQTFWYDVVNGDIFFWSNYTPA